ncbi:MAG: ATP-binding protein [Candidatus Aenigmarchaeota archaeon]|nr:ATP-binding protein [Candidatus Aenigmarchaeota archaeon]MDI6722443.1 ATP-binding protein [Candidatus Aenigmarchaeota archaeon]
MDKGQIIELVKNGENEGLELKESCPSNNKISETICAFANTDGGFLILGINKNKKVKGLAGLALVLTAALVYSLRKLANYKHEDGLTISISPSYEYR